MTLSSGWRLINLNKNWFGCSTIFIPLEFSMKFSRSSRCLAPKFTLLLRSQCPMFEYTVTWPCILYVLPQSSGRPQFFSGSFLEFSFFCPDRKTRYQKHQKHQKRPIRLKIKNYLSYELNLQLIFRENGHFYCVFNMSYTRDTWMAACKNLGKNAFSSRGEGGGHVNFRSHKRLLEVFGFSQLSINLWRFEDPKSG